ncbi:MAG: isoprenylcysteine carboxylmethyltransferase family protein [Pseudomonadota bacterium]
MALLEELKRQGDFLFRYRSYLPLLLLVAAVWVQVYQERFDVVAREALISEWVEGISLVVGLVGLSIRVLTVGYAPANTSGRNTGQGQVAEVLNTTGLYSVVRNPLYVGNYFMWASVAMMTGSIGFVIVFSLAFWIYYERIVFAEEAFLRGKFGSRYLAWARLTPAFVPRFDRYRAPQRRFRWRKVIKQEKNGAVALLALYCLFGLIGDLAEGELSFEEERYSIGAAYTGAVVYLVVKWLKKHTTVLVD